MGGDFNLGAIDWENEPVPPSSRDAGPCRDLIEILNDHHLTQLQREPTRGEALLDLYCTNRPTLVKSITTVPNISDHDGAIVADTDIIPKINKKKPREYSVWSQANGERLKVMYQTSLNNFSPFV